MPAMTFFLARTHWIDESFPTWPPSWRLRACSPQLDRVSFLDTSRNSLSGSLAFCRATPPSACPLALAPRVCACPLSAAPRAWARPLPAASQACLNPSRRLSLQPTRLTYASFGRPWVTPWAYTSPSAGDILASRPASPGHSGCQRLRLNSGDSLSLATTFDAGSTPGRGKYSARDV